MARKCIKILAFTGFVLCFCVLKANSAKLFNHKSRFSPGILFYDLDTNRTILPPSFYQGRANPFSRKCDCKMSDNRMTNLCSCCAGIRLTRFKIQREMCTRFQYNLSKRNQMRLSVTMNGKPLAQNTYNLRAPDLQPLCVPLPIPVIPLHFDFCIKLFEVQIAGSNLHMCMDWSARVEKAPVILLHFDCMEIGASGISFLKPGQTPEPISGQFPSVIGPAAGGSPPIGAPPAGLIEGPPTNPVNPVNPTPLPTSLPAIDSATPDSEGNLPQVGGGEEDLDQVDDLKLKEQNSINRY